MPRAAPLRRKRHAGASWYRVRCIRIMVRRARHPLFSNSGPAARTTPPRAAPLRGKHLSKRAAWRKARSLQERRAECVTAGYAMFFFLRVRKGACPSRRAATSRLLPGPGKNRWQGLSGPGGNGSCAPGAVARAIAGAVTFAQAVAGAIPVAASPGNVSATVPPHGSLGSGHFFPRGSPVALAELLAGTVARALSVPLAQLLTQAFTITGACAVLHLLAMLASGPAFASRVTACRLFRQPAPRHHPATRCIG